MKLKWQNMHLRNLSAFWLSGAAFCVICAIVLWLGFGYRQGMVATELDGTWHNPYRLLPLALLVLLSLGLVAIFVRKALVSPPAWASTVESNWQTVTSLLALGGFAVSLIAVWVLRGFPNSGDEYSYLFEARTFLAGRLWTPLLPGHEFFSFLNIIERDGKWVSVYPPGWPLLLAGIHLVGLPFWMASPILATALLVALAKLCWREDGPVGAVIALVLIVPSPFFAFNGGSFFSQVPAALFGLLFCYFGAEFIDSPRWRSAILAGASLGVLGTIRIFDVFFFVIPFGVEFLLKARRAHYVRIWAMVLGGLPFLAALLLYNRAITGNALLAVFKWAYPWAKLGLHINAMKPGEQLTLRVTMGMAAAHILELAEWTSPLLVLAYGPALVWKSVNSKLRFYDLVFPATVIAYLLWASSGGNRYGPRYYFEAYPLLIATITTMIVDLLREQWRPRVAAMVSGVVTAHLLICCVGLVVLSIFMRKVVDERMDLYDQVRTAGLHDAVIIVHSGTGILRPMSPSDLVRNGLERTADVIYALDLSGRSNELEKMFAGRKFYFYERPESRVHGTVTRLE